MEIIDGKSLAKSVRENLKTEVETLKQKGIIPKFAVILIGNDKASLTYVKSKNKACRELGIEYEEIILEETTQMQELLQIIDNLNERKDISGILLQSPIPAQLDINEAFRRILPSKDVDGFNPYNVGKLCLNQDTFVSCTPYGIMKMLEAYNIDLNGKNAVVIGRSNIVRKTNGIKYAKQKCNSYNLPFKDEESKRNYKGGRYNNCCNRKKVFCNRRYGKKWSSSNRCWNKQNRRRNIWRCRF